MTENQTKNSAKDTALVPLFHTILAAENKTSELFVKSFQYQGENITAKHLGQIFGFFEIPDTREDNEYIVNFLASVVKKEYFINPKRSAADSFEASLHKINLALTELVKQGNTSWLGKLNGVVSVIENNRFHFSVTGDAAILLYRDNQVNTISEGLADKDAALHPLKTFLEISSGDLLLHDKILITSPELFTLCNPETLRKNAFRMDKNGFARYIRAALVNELPLGVSTIIDLDPAPVPVRTKRKSSLLREESKEKLQNVFSSVPFRETKTEASKEDMVETAPAESEEIVLPSEYTDQKTGHIYVQGEAHSDLYSEPSFIASFMQEHFHPALENLKQSIKRATKKSRKTVLKKAVIIGAEGKGLGQALWQASKQKSVQITAQSSKVVQEKLQSIKTQRQKKEMNPEKLFAQEKKERFSEETLPEVVEDKSLAITPESLETSSESTSVTDKRQQALKRFSPHYKPETTKNLPKNLSLSLKLPPSVHIFKKYIHLLSGKQRVLLLILLVGGVTVAIILTRNPSPTTDSQEAPSVASQTQTPVENIPAQPELRNMNELSTWEDGTSVLVVSTDESTVVITPKSVILNNKVFPFVANGNIESAAYMPDLRMIFLWSSANELVSWSLVDQKFTANIFPLPAGADVSNLGAYLTYLYALDNNTGAIYRFARTEGGFSEPTSWLKTPLPKNSTQAFVVHDTIRIATTTTDQYLRGTKEKTLSETSYQVLGSSSAKNFTIGVETKTGKLAIWDTDGNLVHEASHSELVGINAVTYNENTKKLLVTKDQRLIEYTLSW